MRIRRISLVAAAVATAVVLVAGLASAGSGGRLRIEPAWYADHEVSFLQPSLFSAKPNGGVFACFGLGPDLSGVTRPTAPLYVILDPTATQDHCDGDPTALRHDTCSRSPRATVATPAPGRSSCSSRRRPAASTWPSGRSPARRRCGTRSPRASWSTSARRWRLPR